LGGIVINQLTWKRIGELNPRFQADLMRVTRQIAEELDGSMQKTVNDAIQTMSRGGLKVNQPSPAQERQWYTEIDRVVPSMLGSAFDRDIYQKISGILSRYRGGQ
jgi:TRAP-type C4-dicarboxylate transport system substrate-binding protein